MSVLHRPRNTANGSLLQLKIIVFPKGFVVSDEGSETRGERRRKWARGLSHASIGLEMGISVGLGYWAGSWADGYFGTSWLTMTGTLLGVAAAFKALFQLAWKLHKQAEQDEGGEDT